MRTSDVNGDQTGFFPQMVEDDMPRGRGDERSRAFRPLDDDRRPARQVVLPADREHVVLAVQAVEVHVDQQGDSPSRGRIGRVFLVVQVSVVCEPTRTMDLMVDPKGMLTVPDPTLQIPAVACDKMTTEELQQELVRRYQQYILQPQVTVRFGQIDDGGVSPYGFVRVMGMVSRPGPVNMPATRCLTLTQAVQAAGGLRPFANKERIQVTRREKDGSKTKFFLDYDAIGQGGAEDIRLRSGDVVYAHEAIL